MPKKTAFDKLAEAKRLITEAEEELAGATAATAEEPPPGDPTPGD